MNPRAGNPCKANFSKPSKPEHYREGAIERCTMPSELKHTPGPDHYNLQNYRTSGTPQPSTLKDPTALLAAKVKKVQDKYDHRKRVRGCTYNAAQFIHSKLEH